MTTAAERVAAARGEAPRDEDPSPNLVSSRCIADHYGVKVARVADSAGRGAIPGAFKMDGRWIFDFEVAIAGWKPAELIRQEQPGPADPRGHRAAGGKFQKGNTYGVGSVHAGRPPREREKRYMHILNSEVTEEDWTGIIRKAVEQALEGQSRARVWLSNYLLGKPIERILARVEVGAERFSLAERASAVEELLTMLGAGEVIEGEVVDAPEI